MRTSAQDSRTATVRDLRNRFAAVARWIEDGEAVIITRGGEAFAVLAPAPADKPCSVDWTARLKQRPPLGRKLTARETQASYEAMKGGL